MIHYLKKNVDTMETAASTENVQMQHQFTNDIEANDHICKRRLSKGCTHLMYACQQGLTDEIAKELRTKVSSAPTNLFEIDLLFSKHGENVFLKIWNCIIFNNKIICLIVSNSKLFKSTYLYSSIAKKM